MKHSGEIHEQRFIEGRKRENDALSRNRMHRESVRQTALLHQESIKQTTLLKQILHHLPTDQKRS